MKVSVIIPIYNEEKVILNCLKSLSKQTLADFEIIFVDDGSTDSTLSILQGQTLQGKKLIIFNKVIKERELLETWEQVKHGEIYWFL